MSPTRGSIPSSANGCSTRATTGTSIPATGFARRAQGPRARRSGWPSDAVRPFVRLYTDHILNRQAQINLVVWHFLLDSIDRTLLLELEVKKLQHEIDALKRAR